MIDCLVAPNSTAGLIASTDPTFGVGGKSYTPGQIEYLKSRGYDVRILGNKVQIIARINYTGSGATDENIARFNEGISDWWSGTIGKYTVSTFVIAAPGNDNSFSVQVFPGPVYRDSPNEWGATTSEWDAAHETGHLFGLPDRYNIYDPPYQADPKYENNIMGARNHGPSEQDITDIIQRARYFNNKYYGTGN